MEQEKLFEAVESIRRDKHEPWRYILFTFLNGMAQGLGMALGMTVVLALVLYIVTVVLRQFIDFPVVGQFLNDLLSIINTSSKHGARMR